MGFDNICNTGLVLGLGFTSNTHETETPPPSSSNKTSSEYTHQTAKSKNPTVVMALSNNNSFEPSLTLGLSGDHHHHHHQTTTTTTTYLAALPKNIVESAAAAAELLCRQASPNSAVSSFSNASVKRERDTGSDQEVEIERVSSQRLIIDEDEDSINTRKKLRLTKEQSALLEDSFKDHSTLNPKQKQALARQLNLRPRQVEVWFQNRRARTKLKQTEVDCEFLKKCCESLTDENRRLHKELQELKALKVAQPFYMQIPAATLSMCPSCERIGGSAADGASNKTPYAMTSKPHHFYNPFTNPSAAC